MTQRHLYLRDYSKENKHPVGCVAVEVKRETNEICYAISSCSPLDRFNSTVARDKATGRLIAAPVIIKCDIPKSGHEITKRIMQNIVERNESQRGVPNDEAAKDWRNHRIYLAYEAARGWLTRSVELCTEPKAAE